MARSVVRLDHSRNHKCRASYSSATPIRKPVRRTTRHGSSNPSSDTTNVNFAGIPDGSDTSSAAPVIDRSRSVQVILSPPYSICAGFMTRQRGAARVSTMQVSGGEIYANGLGLRNFDFL